jgi:hypothetical protein
MSGAFTVHGNRLSRIWCLYRAKLAANPVFEESAMIENMIDIMLKRTANALCGA